MCSRAKPYKNEPQITLPQISTKCITPDINDLEDYSQGHMASLNKTNEIKMIMMYHLYQRTCSMVYRTSA